MRELNDAARQAMDRYRERVSPGPDAADRSWERIASRIESGEAPLDVDRREPRNAGKRWLVGAVVAAAAAVVAAYGVDAISLVSERGAQAPADPFGAGAVADDDPTDGKAIVRTHRAPAPSPTAASESPTEPEVADVERAPEPAPAKNRPNVRPGTAVQSVRAEMQLVRRAKVALRDGNPAGALSLANRHLREFEDGELAEERELLRITATCELGHARHARQLARAFLVARPRSPLAVHVREICAELGDDREAFP